jgi:hypothetical protein
MGPREPIKRQIERSSFGTPGVRRLRGRTPATVAKRILDRADQPRRGQRRPVRGLDNPTT